MKIPRLKSIFILKNGWILSIVSVLILIGAVGLRLKSNRTKVVKEQPPITIFNTGSGHVEQFYASVDPSGRIYLAWVQPHLGRISAFMQRQESSSTGWSKPTLINASSANRNSTYYPWFSFDTESNVMFVWTQAETKKGYNALYSRLMSNSGKFGPVIRLDQMQGDAYTPHVYYEPKSHRWFAYWSQWDGWADRIFSTVWSSSKGWGKVKPIDAGRTEAYSPRACVGRDGQMVVAWRQLSSRKGHIQDRVYFSSQDANGRLTV